MQYKVKMPAIHTLMEMTLFLLLWKLVNKFLQCAYKHSWCNCLISTGFLNV